MANPVRTAEDGRAGRCRRVRETEYDMADGSHGRSTSRRSRMPTNFNGLGDFSREVSAIEVNISLSAKRVIRLVVQPLGGRGPVLDTDMCASGRCWTAVSAMVVWAGAADQDERQ